MITTNLSFSEWDVIFNDKMLATAAIVRLAHYSHIYKFDDHEAESYRSEEAAKQSVKMGLTSSMVTD